VTLVQVLANETSLHMACDFCLTDYDTGKVVRNDAFKLVTVTSPSMLGLVGVTGLGSLENKPIGAWITDVMSGIGGRRSVEDVLDALAREAEGPLARIASPVKRRHSFVVAAVVGSQTHVSLVSNFQVLERDEICGSPAAALTLTVTSTKPKSAQLFATHPTLPDERQQLERMLRSGSSEASIQEQLSKMNVAVSRRTETAIGKSVSEGCYVASLNATGRGTSQSFFTDEQKTDILPPDVEQYFRRLGVSLKPKIGPDGKPSPIQVVGSTLVKTSRSAKHLREQLKLQPDSAEVWNNYGVFLEDRRQFAEAIAAYERAMVLDPSYAWAISNLALQYWLRKADIAEADRLYSEAVRVAGPSALPRILSDFAVFCDEGLADTKRALELHRRALDEEDQPLVKARLAYFLMKHGQELEQASSLFKAALTEQPDDPLILRIAGEADWFYKGDREAARTKLHKACTMNPRDHHTWRLAGDVSLVLGDAGSAAYYYRKAMKRGASGWEIHGSYGLALLLNRKPDGALRHLSEARRSAPDDAGLLTNTAAALWAVRRNHEAVALMRQVVSQRPAPEIEIEVLALLRLAAPPARQEMIRLRDLLSGGHRGDGSTVRTMVWGKPSIDRSIAFGLADIIEGKAPLPPNL
jgi:Tfp pilus assembly protein PilF